MGARKRLRFRLVGTLVTLDVINGGVTMIVSYRDKDTERLSRGIRVPKFVVFERQAMRKLRQLEIAGSLNDLRVPPGNHLEALEGDRAGQHSVRVNDQYRICFVWTPTGVKNVEIVDYHR